MEKSIQKFAFHLDYLRREYNMTEDQFCEGICDTRSYRRYISGERKLPHKKIMEFCDKLGISSSDFFYNSKTIEREELNKIRKLYENIADKDYISFYKNRGLVNQDRILNEQNRKYFSLCNIKADYETHKTLDQVAVTNMAKLINYPRCINKRIFDFIEMAALSFIASIEIKVEETQALDKLISILSSVEFIYINSESRYILPTIYANASIYLGRLKRFEESLKIADAGIKYCKGVFDLHALSYLRYMRAYCLLVLGQQKESELEAIRCLALAIGKDNKLEMNSFKRVLQKDFKFNPLDLIKKYEDDLFSS